MIAPPKRLRGQNGQVYGRRTPRVRDISLAPKTAEARDFVYVLSRPRRWRVKNEQRAATDVEAGWTYDSNNGPVPTV